MQKSWREMQAHTHNASCSAKLIRTSQVKIMGDDVFSLVSLLSLTDDELLMFDLQSLATLATARALEMGPQDSSRTGSCQNFPPRRVLNLRRKCSWTPRNEPVSTKYTCEAWQLAYCQKFFQ